MGPDEEKRLRQILFKKQQLPEPAWNLFNRTTRRFSRAIEQQEKPVSIIDDKTSKRYKKRQGGKEI